VNHSQAKDSSSYGSVEKPWKTLQYAFMQLEPGDTLLIRDGTYENRYIELKERNSGQESALITVQAYPGEIVILRNGQAIAFFGTSWWTIEGLIFDEPKDHYILLGMHKNLGHDATLVAEHITIRNCEFKNGSHAAIKMNFANDILIENNYFHHIRPGVSYNDSNGDRIGWEMNAVDIAYTGDNITIKGCRFEEIGSDGVHIGAQSYKAGSSIGAVFILGNEFWVNRPYEGILGNIGENGIDVKKVQGPILIADNIVHGFRPTTPEQDTSGASGAGITLHNGAQNVLVERNLLYDNTRHLVVSQGSVGTPGGTRNILIRNNILREARNSGRTRGYALKVDSAVDVEVYHNTFYDNEIYLRSYGSMHGTFKNNVIIGGRAGTDHDSAWEADYNAWVEVEGEIPPLLQGGHDLWARDPVLDLNLIPLPGSPLIDTGLDVGVPDDFTGDPRLDGSPDLGALEYRGKPQVFLRFVIS
jgi:hypothetical protein